MRTNRLALTLTVTVIAALPGASHGQDEPWRRMLKASVAEQTAWINSDLSRGMPEREDDGGVLIMLILNRSSVALPLIESKIEEVLHSASPSERFTNKSVDPQKFVHSASLTITSAGNIESLKQAGKLIKIDEKLFGWMVERTLTQAMSYRNPFGVAYQGLELGQPAVASRTVAWVQAQLAERKYSTPGGAEAETLEVRRWLAEAMVERYGSAPTEPQWWADPLISRLPPPQATWMHDDVMRLASEAARKRAKP